MKVIFRGRKNEELISKRGGSDKQQRFCEVCGTFVGAMTSKEWDLEVWICKTCVEAYTSSLEIEMDAERSRISRFI